MVPSCPTGFCTVPPSQPCTAMVSVFVIVNVNIAVGMELRSTSSGTIGVNASTEIHTGRLSSS